MGDGEGLIVFQKKNNQHQSWCGWQLKKKKKKIKIKKGGVSKLVRFCSEATLRIFLGCFATVIEGFLWNPSYYCTLASLSSSLLKIIPLKDPALGDCFQEQWTRQKNKKSTLFCFYLLNKNKKEGKIIFFFFFFFYKKLRCARFAKLGR